MAATFTPPAAREYAPFYAGYIARVPEGDLEAQLARQHERTRALLAPLSASQARHRYAPGKWSVIEVLGHMADAERVFAYRALRFARGDETPLAGFDEAAWVPAGGFERRALGDVLDEFGAVRKATLALLGGLDPEAVDRSGLANDKPITVRALAYIIAGHELHHVAVLRERYGLGDAAR
jgi:hypothetical protein